MKSGALRRSFYVPEPIAGHCCCLGFSRQGCRCRQGHTDISPLAPPDCGGKTPLFARNAHRKLCRRAKRIAEAQPCAAVRQISYRPLERSISAVERQRRAFQHAVTPRSAALGSARVRQGGSACFDFHSHRTSSVIHRAWSEIHARPHVPRRNTSWPIQQVQFLICDSAPDCGRRQKP